MSTPPKPTSAALWLGVSANLVAIAALAVATAAWLGHSHPRDCEPPADDAEPEPAPEPELELAVGGLVTTALPTAQAWLAASTPSPTATASPASHPEPSEPAEPDPLAADDATKLALFHASPEDPPPPYLGGTKEENYGRHYWSSDEWNHHLFAPHLEKLGGGYVGVGPDQAYLMIGWIEPEYAWVIDYDPMIVDLHRVYAALFMAAETPAQFMRLWSEEAKHEVRALIGRRYADVEQAEWMWKIYQRALARVPRRLELLHAKHTRDGVRSFLTDDGQYQRIRELITAGRVRPMQVDLTGELGLAGIGAAAKQLGIPIRALYLSNAEQYWSYADPFRANIQALPFDERSVVLRTLSSHDVNQDYRYNLQAALDYQARIADPTIRRSFQFVDQRPLAGPDDVAFTITSAPPPDPAEIELAAFESLTASPCATNPAGMACIPGGPFVRGTDDGPIYAQPSATVWLQTFYMDTHEVTYADYQACEARGACPLAEPRYADFDHPRQPMNGVSWYDADAYCRAAGKHLPTEAEWEKAARGPDGGLYPWGDEPATCEYAVIMADGERSCGVRKRFGDPTVGRPFEVGSKPPNHYGLYDMAGNAYEWVADWFTINYAKCGDDCTGVDPKGPCAGEPSCRKWPKKVVRGGSWFWPAYHASAVHRRAHAPDNQPFHHFGFRCAASISEAAGLVTP